MQKETIQPSVVHTTVPVHEVHHNEAKHHNASALPAVSMSEFKKSGGSLTGRDERTDAFDGEPRAVGSNLGGKVDHTIGGHGAAGTTHLTEQNGGHNTSGTTGATNGSPMGSHSGTDVGQKSKPSLMDKINPKIDSNGDGKAGFMK